MRIRFDGKTVVVSGAGQGFGRCIAETFAGLGARVFGCDLSAAELAETARAGVTTEILDLTDRAAAAAWIARVEQTTGGAVDVLVNNAGGVAGQEMRPIEAVPDASPDRKSTRLNSSHTVISYAVFCLKKKKKTTFHFLSIKTKKKIQEIS